MPTAFAIVAHPDDIEFVMSGTLMRLHDVGYTIHYMNIANGSCGSTEYGRDELVAMRREEAIAACKLVGAVHHESLCDDLAIFFDKPTLARLASIVRDVAPDIVLTHAPADYMEDHMNTCRLAVTATFTRGMPNFPVDPSRPAIDCQTAVYHAQPHSNRDPLGNVVRPSLFVDVSDLREQKLAMLACHKSQQAWLSSSQGLNSYLQTMLDMNREVGQMSGRFELAEGWRQHHWPGYCNQGDDPLAILGKHAIKSA